MTDHFDMPSIQEEEIVLCPQCDEPMAFVKKLIDECEGAMHLWKCKTCTFTAWL